MDITVYHRYTDPLALDNLAAPRFSCRTLRILRTTGRTHIEGIVNVDDDGMCLEPTPSRKLGSDLWSGGEHMPFG